MGSAGALACATCHVDAIARDVEKAPFPEEAMLGCTGVDLAPTTGVAISVAQKAALQSSLPLLKKNYKFSDVYLFGKVLSKAGDYLIAYGLEGSITSKKWFYWCVPDGPWHRPIDSAPCACPRRARPLPLGTCQTVLCLTLWHARAVAAWTASRGRSCSIPRLRRRPCARNCRLASLSPARRGTSTCFPRHRRHQEVRHGSRRARP